MCALMLGSCRTAGASPLLEHDGVTVNERDDPGMTQQKMKHTPCEDGECVEGWKDNYVMAGVCLGEGKDHQCDVCDAR